MAFVEAVHLELKDLSVGTDIRVDGPGADWFAVVFPGGARYGTAATRLFQACRVAWIITQAMATCSLDGVSENLPAGHTPVFCVRLPHKLGQVFQVGGRHDLGFSLTDSLDTCSGKVRYVL